MENKKNRYVIGKNVYEKHIDDEVHLYGLLHQLAAQAERIRDEEDVFHLLDTVKKYGAIADEMFDGWGIPGRYLVFGEKKARVIFCLASRDGKEHIPAVVTLMRMVKTTALIHDLEESRSEEELYQTVLNCEFEVL